MTLFFPSFFDLLLFDVCGFVFLAWLGFSWKVRRREDRLDADPDRVHYVRARNAGRIGSVAIERGTLVSLVDDRF